MAYTGSVPGEGRTEPCGSVQVAIKKVLQDKRFKNRELQIMKMMSHPNVVSLKHCFYSTTEKEEVRSCPPSTFSPRLDACMTAALTPCRQPVRSDRPCSRGQVSGAAGVQIPDNRPMTQCLMLFFSRQRGSCSHQPP